MLLFTNTTSGYLKKNAALYTVHTFNFYTICTLSTSFCTLLVSIKLSTSSSNALSRPSNMRLAYRVRLRFLLARAKLVAYPSILKKTSMFSHFVLCLATNPISEGLEYAHHSAFELQYLYHCCHCQS